ncbi:Venom carboxylesterase-6, partial [Pseudolycoriella hygida]
LSSCDNDAPVVEVRQGKILGKTLTSRNGREFFSFFSIPYGQAERFQAPSIAANWNGTLEATQYGLPCAQKTWITNENLGEENCLKLQVFTPSLTNNMPVMVYFHGGGFTIGTGNILQPQYFMDEDIVLVVVNYRLGPFGFLSLQDEHIPGNNGLKDQSVALKWVQQNIVNFGGNPKKVTIFGNSAGAASVSFHMLSQQSSYLFHSAIMQSGSSLNPWAMSKHPKEMASRYGENVGCSTSDSTSFLDCLKTKTTNEILDAMESLTQWNYDPFTPFGVVVEPETPGAFITVDPLISLRLGNFSRVPVIIGVVEDEGILLHSACVAHVDEISFLFADSYQVAPEFQKNSVAEGVSKKFVKLWASFATNGSPTELWGVEQKWEPISADEREEKTPLQYYRIDEDTSVINEPFTNRMNFWKELLHDSFN